MMHSCRATVAVVLCLVLPLTLASCKDDSADPAPATCTGAFVTPADSAILATAVTCNVRWRADLGDAVDIVLLKDDQPVGRVAEGAPNTGYFPWIVSTFGQDAGDGYRLRVTAAGDDGCGVTGGPLRVADSDACSLEFYPIYGGHAVGAEASVYWAGRGGTGRVNLDLVRLDSMAPPRVVAHVGRNLPDTGWTTWIVSTYGEEPGHYLLRLTDAAITSCSADSDPFSIYEPGACYLEVTTPTLAQVLAPGTVVDVVYRPLYAVGALRLDLYAGTQRLGTVAAEVDLLDDTFAWTVTDLGHDDPDAIYTLRLIDLGAPDCYAVSPWFLIRR